MSLICSQVSDKYLTPHDNIQVLKFEYSAEKRAIIMLQVAWDKYCAIREEQRAGTEHHDPLHGTCSYGCYTTRKAAVLLEHSEGVEMAKLSCSIFTEILFALFLPDVPTLSI